MVRQDRASDLNFFYPLPTPYKRENIVPKGKNKKFVLIADDELRMREILHDRFAACDHRVECPYKFGIEEAMSASECIQKVRAKKYDVIILDVRMEEKTSGLGVNLALALGEELGYEEPVKIIFTGYPNYKQCVEAMRHGAWDYIVKEDDGTTPAAQVVVNSAVARLQELDLRRELEQQIAAEWLPQYLRELQAKYGGMLVAIWHRPEIAVVTSGTDAFELEVHLRKWRQEHAEWEQPFLVRIPKLSTRISPGRRKSLAKG
jgi:FixJ family two-component response regulator